VLTSSQVICLEHPEVLRALFGHILAHTGVGLSAGQRKEAAAFAAARAE
jgi:hypothetical protein